MGKFTRTVYATGSLRDIAHEIANQAAITNRGGELGLAYDTLHLRSAKGRRRVRTPTLAEPEKAPPKAPRAPRRPRPVQAALPLEPTLETLGDIAATVDPMTLRTREPRFRMPLYGADGGAT